MAQTNNKNKLLLKRHKLQLMGLYKLLKRYKETECHVFLKAHHRASYFDAFASDSIQIPDNVADVV